MGLFSCTSTLVLLASDFSLDSSSVFEPKDSFPSVFSDICVEHFSSSRILVLPHSGPGFCSSATGEVSSSLSSVGVSTAEFSCTWVLTVLFSGVDFESSSSIVTELFSASFAFSIIFSGLLSRSLAMTPLPSDFFLLPLLRLTNYFQPISQDFSMAPVLVPHH